MVRRALGLVGVGANTECSATAPPTCQLVHAVAGFPGGTVGSVFWYPTRDLPILGVRDIGLPLGALFSKVAPDPGSGDQIRLAVLAVLADQLAAQAIDEAGLACRRAGT